MAQTWNNLLGYIKLNLGAKLNLLELTDEEIMDAIREHVIPYFSQYIPYKKYLYLPCTAQMSDSWTPGQNQWTYRIPIEPNEYIIDIIDVYIAKANTILDDYGFTIASSTTMIDMVMANTLLDMAQYLRVRQTWEFMPPNIMMFDQELREGAIVVYNVNHRTLDTIMPDAYETIFKQLSLGNVQKWLVALRSKYESIATPSGEIRINWQRLEEESVKNIDQAQAKLDTAPMDKFIEIF